MNPGHDRPWRREPRKPRAKTRHQTVGKLERVASLLDQDLAAKGGAHQAVRRMRAPHQQVMPDFVREDAPQRTPEQFLPKAGRPVRDTTVCPSSLLDGLAGRFD